jgi:hypothetical protein
MIAPENARATSPGCDTLPRRSRIASMESARLPSNATLLTVRDELNEPIAYVRQVLQHMLVVGPNARLRISVHTGVRAPDYLVEHVTDEDIGGLMPVDAYMGRTHRPLRSKRSLNDDYWSGASMSIQEVRLLLGELRNFKPKR